MVPVPKKFNFGPQMARSRRLALSTLAVVDQSFELENTSKQLIPLGVRRWVRCCECSKCVPRLSGPSCAPGGMRAMDTNNCHTLLRRLLLIPLSLCTSCV